ncbi:MAG: aminoacyl-tRNA hydrolase [Candidatus Buchananbacteria bacterium RIFCSPHIGHO2_02_FULL_38_8]|uniref:Peptidyl-tRNA hydrolase n=1 Tax=Candidatus Buchananbacteria bacterium RIFCSPHIGHO2_02_FULL_38_8 TaxID=1797538 RepID=A0A1G1Y3C9_9BACT|nr:MAG: aminoacyl-tRNA hydrolase [Candidatus Buchananbacteria bacterium RIFCSPHIGHO2_02_FULL_38_8]
MKLIVGLGNPGKKNQDTWHNAGFLALDEFKKNKDWPDFKISKKFKAEISEGSEIEEKIVLAKPQTFMNNSGESVKALVKFYKIEPKDIWIIHDDIDLPLGKIRVSQNSSAAGHKGVQSIIDQLGTQEFIRFRIGIQPESRGQLPTEDYVLQKIDKPDTIKQTIENIVSAFELALMNGVSEAMNEFN